MAKTPPTQAVVRREPKLPDQSNTLPEHLRNDAMRGLEHATKEDFVIPRLVVCQNMSLQREKNNKPEAITGLEEGMFFNTLTREIYGEVEMLVTPLMFYRNRWYFEKDTGNILCFSPDSYTQGVLSPQGCDKCSHSQFIDGEKPDCTLFNNVPVLIHHVDGDRSPELAVVSMHGAGLKGAREWNTLMRFRNHDVFGGLYILKGVQKPSPQGGSYYVIEARNAGVVKDAELFHFAESQYEQLSKQDLASNPQVIDKEPEQDPGM